MTVSAARRFLRARWLWTAVAPVAVAVAVIAAVHVLLQAQSLSPRQVVERDLGRFGAYAGFGVAAVRPGRDARDVLLEAVRPVAGADVDVSLVVNDFALPALHDGPVTLTERRWDALPFRQRYRLDAGRWPRRPGEVALVGAGAGRAGPTPSVGAGTAAARLRVTGRATNRFGRDPEVLAAPGTWAALPPGLARANPFLRAQPVVYWDGARPAAVLDALAVAYRRLGAAGSVRRVRRALEASFADRARVAAAREPSWLSESPAGSTIPAVLVPLLAVLLAFRLARRRLDPALAAMVAVGVRVGSAARAGALAVGTACLAAGAAGALVGLGVGAAVARGIAAAVDGPRPALPAPTSVVALPAAMLLLGCGLASVPLWRALAGRPARAGRWRSGLGARPRRLLAGALAVGAAVSVARLASAPGAMVLFAVVATALVLVLPDVLALALARLPERRLTARLAKRRLLADRGRAGAYVATLGVLVGLSTGFVALLDTMIRTSGAQVDPLVLPGQLKLADRRSDVLPPPAAARRTVARVPGLGRAAVQPLRYLAAVGPAGGLRRQVLLGDDAGLVFAVDTLADARALAGAALPGAAAAALARGGVVSWSAPVVAGRSTLRTVDGAGRVVGAPVALPAARMPIPRAELTAGTAGLTLTATGRRLGLPVVTGATLYTGVAPPVARAARAALARAGQDRESVQVYARPAPPIPPLALALTAIGLVVLTVAMTAATAAAQVAAHRPALRQLVALGVSPGWARRTMLRQMAILALAAIAFGLLVGPPVAVVAAWRIPGFVLSVPWGQLLLLTGAVLASTGAVTLLAGRRLDRYP